MTPEKKNELLLEWNEFSGNMFFDETSWNSKMATMGYWWLSKMEELEPELPSDEEIEKKYPTNPEDILDREILDATDEAFLNRYSQIGAKWMRNRVTGKK